MIPTLGRGPQVFLSGPAQRAARGGAGVTMRENVAYKELLEAAGISADGSTVDGSTLTGFPAEDPVYSRPGCMTDIPPSRDLIPSWHLSNLVGKTTAKVTIIGDSTATEGPVQDDAFGGGAVQNGVDQSQMIWAMLCDKLRADNPQITDWTFNNRAIGGTAENGPILNGHDLHINQTTFPWFTDLDGTWLSQIEDDGYDVLFYLFGTNASASGSGGAGINASTFIRENMEAIEAWDYVPNVVIITSKTSTPTDPTPGPDDYAASNHLGQAAFHRTFARTSAAGYQSFSNVTAKGFGLIDLGRYAAARIYGYDPAVQYLRAAPQYLRTNWPIPAMANNGENASTVAKTLHGDYRITFVMRGQGGDTLFNYGDGHSLLVSVSSNFLANYLRFNIGAGGTVTPSYILDGNISHVSPSPSQFGSTVATANGQDVVFTISAVGSRIRVWINGTLAMDIIAPRFITPRQGGATVNINFASDAVGHPTLDLTEFYEGIGAPVRWNVEWDTAFGVRSSGTSLVDDFDGGNSINHQTSLGAAFDRRVIDAMDFAVPNVLPRGLLTDAVNDAAAETAGIAVEGYYRNGSVVMQRVS